MENIYCILLLFASSVSLILMFVCFKNYTVLLRQNLLINDKVIENLHLAKAAMKDVADDTGIIQNKINEFIAQYKVDESRKSTGESQLDNLKKAFRQPVKIHERS